MLSVTGAVLFGACSPSGSGAKPSPEQQAYVAVTPSPGAPPLDFGQPAASMEAVLSNHGRQRVDGEKAARDIAKLLLDSRSSMPGEEVLGLISSPNLPATTRAGLIWDYDRTSNRGANMRRHCEPAAGAYARSSYEGSVSRPTRVSFNFACFETSDQMKFGTWYITSYDVEPSQSGGWQLAEAGFGKAPIGVSRITMTAAERSELLVGSGWRRLGP